MIDMKKIILVFILAMSVPLLWDSVPIIKDSVHAVLNPTFGALLEWHIVIGFLIVAGFLSLLLSLAQKFVIDQDALKAIKDKQKKIQKKMKDHQKNGEHKKVMELQKEMFSHMGETMKHSMEPMIYTMIPMILFFRWFYDTLHPIWGNWWLAYYIGASMAFSIVLRKILKLA